MQIRRPKIAESILRANAFLYPNSANVYDSYAEALMMNGDLEAAMKNYEKAVEVAVKTDDGNTELFKDNLEAIKKKIEAAK